MSIATPRFEAALIARYDRPGPRYTSYPSALQFTEAFDRAQYLAAIERSNATGGPLSLYLHAPFCPEPCYYCGCTRVITRQPQVIDTYVRRLAEEISLQGYRFGGERVVEQLHLGGGTPTYFTLEQLTALMDALSLAFVLCHAPHREYSIEMDPRSARPGLLEGLAALGFNRLSLGIQDFDPAVQRAVNRVQFPDDVAMLVHDARRCGFKSISFDLIYGLPLQTPASFRRTLDQVLSLRPDRIAAYGYAHLPGRFKAQRQIDPGDLPPPAVRLDLLGLTVEKLTAAGYAYIGMDHFALATDELAVAQRAGTLQRNFQGYSTRAGLDVVGLGLSAIGRVGDSYAQNAKTLNAYYGHLDNRELPIERGLRLGPDDIVRRAAIESLMCQGRIDIARFERAHGVDFAPYFAPALRQLEPMAADGLVRVDARSIEVTDTGRLLLRVIAMAFDAYLPQSPEASRHSRVI